MLNDPQNIEDLVEALEVRFLANKGRHLRFGLLTDYQDAHAETLPEDEVLLRLAETRIEELRNKFRVQTATRSFCFIGRAAGIRATGSGWATSASAGSWRI